MNETKQPGGKTHLVFVYGTLKEGYGNHAFFLKDRAEFVSYGKTKDKLVMFSTPGFPVVMNNLAKDAPIEGEIYEINDDILARLDQLESNGSMYVRGYYDIELLDGSVIPCWMYVGVPACWNAWAEGREPINKTDGVYRWGRT